jgi:serine/threonine protein kinase
LKKLITNASPDAIDFMISTLQYDSRKRPTASELLKHPFFKNHSISKDVYQYATGKKAKLLEAKKRGTDIESLKIGPNGITIETEDVDNSPFNLDNYNQARGLRSGFDLRKKAIIKAPMLKHKSSYNEIAPNNKTNRISIHENHLLKGSILLQNSEAVNPIYYKTEEPKQEVSEFKTRIKEPLFPYYQSNNEVLNNLNIPSLQPEDRRIYKPRLKEIAKNQPFGKYEAKFNLAQPALVTNNKNDLIKKNKKYEFNFVKKQKEDETETYRPSDSYAKRVLNAQQSLPDLQNRKYNELDRYV